MCRFSLCVAYHIFLQVSAKLCYATAVLKVRWLFTVNGGVKNDDLYQTYRAQSSKGLIDEYVVWKKISSQLSEAN